MKKNDEIIAICYLSEAADSKNKCYFTKDQLFILTHGNKEIFDNEDVKGVIFKEKKLLIPIIMGGIGASLGLVAIFTNLYNPWLTMILVFGFGLWFYYGWQGLPAFVVLAGKGEHAFLIRNVPLNLQQFFSYYASFLPQNINNIYHRYFYKLVPDPEKHFEDHFKGFVQNPEDHRMFTYQQILSSIQQSLVTNQFIMIIDPTLIRSEIIFTHDPEIGEIRPHLQGRLPDSAIVGVVSSEDFIIRIKNTQ